MSGEGNAALQLNQFEPVTDPEQQAREQFQELQTWLDVSVWIVINIS